MWRWACVCLSSAALALAAPGCGDDACVRRSDCRSGLHCLAGRCVAPDASTSDASAGDDVTSPDAPLDAPQAPPDGTDAAGPADASTGDSNAADAPAADAAPDGGTDA